MVEYAAFWIAGFLCRTIPLHFAYWLSLRISDCYFFFERRGRNAVMANLRQVMAFRGRHPTERELKLTARTTFQFFGKYLVDFFRFQRLSEDDIKRLVTIEHPEYIEQSWQMGKGVIAVTAHLGNWEIGGAVLAGMGYPINVVALKQPSAKLNDFFQKHRRKRGMVVVPLGSSVKRLIGALRRKEFIALLADRDYSDHHGTTSLCGAPACMPRGAAWLAAKTGAVVLPGFVLRNEDDTFLMKMYPPIIPVEGMSQDDIQARINAALEDAIGAYPHQWFMFQSVWGGLSYGQSGKRETPHLNPLPQGERTRGNPVPPFKGCVIIPAYREAGRIGEVVEGIKSFVPDVIVVDDGSPDETAAQANQAGAIVIQHEVNCGKGAALESGFRAARERGFDFVITMDGDGQHAPTDLPGFIQAYHQTGTPVLVGSRMSDTRDMPLVRRMTNQFMSWLLSREMGQWVPDTQCGYRLYELSVLPAVASESKRFAAESEILMELSHKGVKIGSVPIATIYGTEKSKIHPVKDAFRFFKMMRQYRKRRSQWAVGSGQ